jgi:hypothetical protein
MVWDGTRTAGAGDAGVAKANECQTCPRLVSSEAVVENGAVRVPARSRIRRGISLERSGRIGAGRVADTWWCLKIT